MSVFAASVAAPHIAVTAAFIAVAAASISIPATTVAVPTVTITGASVAITPSAAVIALIPRAGTDKETAREPVSTVVAVRGTSIRIVGVVAVVAHRGSVNVAVSVSISRVVDDRADANTNGNLRVGGTGGERERQGQQS